MSTHGKRPGDPRGVDTAPPRLVEDPATSALVRQDLANVASAAPSYDAASGFLALQAAIGAGATVAAGAGGATAAKAALGLKLKLAAIAGAVGAVAIASAVLLMQPRGEAPAPSRKASSAQQPSQHPPGPLTDAVPPVEPPAVPSAQPAPLEPAAPDRGSNVVSPAQHDHAAAEIALLAQIKAVIDHAPARALRLAEQGQRRFGDGYLHHEREGLAIVALHALGRRDEAQTRASAYLARYPHSPMSDRVRALGREGAAP